MAALAGGRGIEPGAAYFCGRLPKYERQIRQEPSFLQLHRGEVAGSTRSVRRRVCRTGSNPALNYGPG